MVRSVRDKHIAKIINSNAKRSSYLCSRGWTTITTEAMSPGTRERDNRAIRHTSNAATTSDEHAAMLVHSNSERWTQHGSRGRAVITIVAMSSCSGKGNNRAIWQHLSDAIVRSVRDEHVAQIINSNAIRIVQHGSRGWAAITAVARSTSACHSEYYTV